MLFLAFLHKITQNCNLGSSKTWGLECGVYSYKKAKDLLPLAFLMLILLIDTRDLCVKFSAHGLDDDPYIAVAIF